MVEDFNQFLNKELNEQQLSAATIPNNTIVVIAGAGSGKTRVITARMANLILNLNFEPSSILALTFTNKAAAEMKARLQNFLGLNYKMPFVGTFHSYCLLLLRSNPSLLSYPDFSILDSDDQQALVKKIIKKYGLEKQLSSNEVLYQISNIKNKLNTENFTLPIIKEIYLAYETEKVNNKSLDFDDLLLEVLKILKNNKEFRENFQKRVRHILVDEYQDTNLVQHELLKYMALDEDNKFNINSLCAVGDEDQSIYSWRGAISTNMLKLQKDFAPAVLVKIEQNYRSVQPILDAANQVIANNIVRTPKKLWSTRQAKNRILCVNCRTEQQEAYAIATFINYLKNNYKLKDIAILYRAHYQSRSIEEALLRNSINYKIIGGIRFYERKEIKDLLAYLRLVVNPYDKVSLFRVINIPNRGLGNKFEEYLQDQIILNPLLNFKELLNYLINKPESELTGIKLNNLKMFLDLFEELNLLDLPSKIIETLIEKLDYLGYLQKICDHDQLSDKVENIKEFVQSIYDFEYDCFKNNNQQATLKDFLYQISLMQDKLDDKQDLDNQVQCMTIHAAKGLEFDVVFMAGLEEGVLPNLKSLNTNQALEEERRLFYVGVTRAKERLILLRSFNRNTFGQITDQVASRFLTEVPDKLIKTIDISEFSTERAGLIFNDWLANEIKNNNQFSNILTFSDFSNKNTYINKKIETKKHTINLDNKNNLNNNHFKVHQLVQHTKFGPGVIKKIEHNGQDLYVTVAFRVGEKKILSNFLKSL